LDLNLEYQQSRECRDRARYLVAEAVARATTSNASGPQEIDDAKSAFSNQYMFAKLEPSVIRGGNPAR